MLKRQLLDNLFKMPSIKRSSHSIMGNKFFPTTPFFMGRRYFSKKPPLAFFKPIPSDFSSGTQAKAKDMKNESYINPPGLVVIKTGRRAMLDLSDSECCDPPNFAKDAYWNGVTYKAIGGSRCTDGDPREYFADALESFKTALEMNKKDKTLTQEQVTNIEKYIADISKHLDSKLPVETQNKPKK